MDGQMGAGAGRAEVITRRRLMQSALGAVIARPAHARDRKPNLLFIIADDHAAYVTGHDGNSRAQTPNLDRLAGEGMRFAAHYCNSPVCTPSRQSILTGLLPHATGVTRLPTPLSENSHTIAKVLKSEGMSTAVMGKMHFNQPGKPGLHGFDVAWTEEIIQRRWNQAVGPTPNFGDVRTKPAWKPFQDPARVWLNAEKLPFPRHYEQMKSTWLAAQACRYLEEHKDDRFALWVSFQEPHSPYDFPVEWSSKFKSGDFPVPRVGPADGEQIPLIFRDLTAAEKQGIAAAYYTSVSFLDYNIGVVLNKLRELRLEEDTLVVYMADHGYCLGQHGRFEKHCGYDPALRVPLVFRMPGRTGKGVVTDFTESVDVASTVLDLLGAGGLPGTSLRPYLEGKRASRPRSSIFSEYLENEEAYLRTDRWKLIHGSGKRERTDGYKTAQPTPGRTVLLFDLKKDPGEFENVAGKHGEVVAKLSAEMLDRIRQTHPEARMEPEGLKADDALEWYLRPRDV